MASWDTPDYAYGVVSAIDIGLSKLRLR